MLSRLWSFRRHQEGQDLVEYALIIALVAIAAIAALTRLGHSVSAILDQAAHILQVGAGAS